MAYRKNRLKKEESVENTPTQQTEDFSSEFFVEESVENTPTQETAEPPAPLLLEVVTEEQEEKEADYAVPPVVEEFKKKVETKQPTRRQRPAPIPQKRKPRNIPRFS